jgi:hypothetical protein
MLLKSFMVLIPYIAIQDTLPYVDNSPFRIQEEEGLQNLLIKKGVSLSILLLIAALSGLPVSLHNLLTHSINIGLHAAPLSPWLHNTFKF